MLRVVERERERERDGGGNTMWDDAIRVQEGKTLFAYGRVAVWCSWDVHNM